MTEDYSTHRTDGKYLRKWRGTYGDASSEIRTELLFALMDLANLVRDDHHNCDIESDEYCFAPPFKSEREIRRQHEYLRTAWQVIDTYMPTIDGTL